MARLATREGRERFRQAAERQVGDTRVPGLVALMARGEDVEVVSAGKLAIDGAPVAADSLFRIASTTKPIAAAAALVLVEEGLMEIDESVERLLPELANRRVLRRMDGPLSDTVAAERPITVRDLLTSTFGFGIALEMFMAREPWPIVRATAELGLATLGGPSRTAQPDPDGWISALGTLPLLAQPGERWLYNTASSVLGVLIARAARQTLAEVLATRIFDPLGMVDTAFWTDETDRLATCYRATPDRGLELWDAPDGAWSRPPAFADAGGGLVSSAADLLAFARMLLSGGAGVLSRQSVTAMTSDQLTERQKSYGGLGSDFFAGRSWGFGQAVLDSGAYGWDGALGTSWLVDPTSELVVIVLTQRMFETSALPRAHREILAAAYDA